MKSHSLAIRCNFLVTNDKKNTFFGCMWTCSYWSTPPPPRPLSVSFLNFYLRKESHSQAGSATPTANCDNVVADRARIEVCIQIPNKTYNTNIYQNIPNHIINVMARRARIGFFQAKSFKIIQRAEMSFSRWPATPGGRLWTTLWSECSPRSQTISSPDQTLHLRATSRFSREWSDLTSWWLWWRWYFWWLLNL